MKRYVNIYVGKRPINKFIKYLYRVKDRIARILDEDRIPIPHLKSGGIKGLSKQEECYLCGISFKKKGYIKGWTIPT